MMTDEGALLRLAERLREMAGGTQMPHYTNMMLHAARELEAQVCALQAVHLSETYANGQPGDDRDSHI